MFARSKAALTFLCLVVALGLATTSEANTLVHPARDHAQLSRMIKQRVPRDTTPFLPIIGAEGDPGKVSSSTPPTSASVTASVASVSASASAASVASSLASSDSVSASASSVASASSSVASASSDASSLASSASLSATSSSAPPSSVIPSTTPESTTPTPTTAAELSFTQAPGPDTDTQADTARHTSTNFVTVTDSSQAKPTSGAELSSAAKDSSNSHITRTTIIVIAVVASTVGGIALAWTIFRKWKLRPSSDFDDRMQPIDWQPTSPEDNGIVPSHRRVGSGASHGSFRSSGHSDGHSQGLQPLPEHDFTAGPTTLAPVGGYADLQRGPSPQPSMAELSRGPSMNRPGYDYGVPVHHQAMGAYDYNRGPRY
ncbi:hypothetical protein BC628DRAFT_1408008 [Trametes gibbosa]|nr:hypothetical protein BC628DRAFT_1408008 [Trametes gibbosa]